MIATMNRNTRLDPIALATAAGLAATAGWLAGRAGTGGTRGQLRHAVYHDTLTGLYNRAGWRRHATHAVAAAAHAGRPAAVGLVDIDWLKTINDQLGHAAGDQALTTLADRLDRAVSGPGLAARLGGDEFAFVLVGPPRAGSQWLARAAHRVHDLLCQPVALAGAPRELHVSVGLAPIQGPDELAIALAQADWVMYRVKHTPDNVAVYTGRHRHPTG